jgi:hypothetical protein
MMQPVIQRINSNVRQKRKRLPHMFQWKRVVSPSCHPPSSSISPNPTTPKNHPDPFLPPRSLSPSLPSSPVNVALRHGDGHGSPQEDAPSWSIHKDQPGAIGKGGPAAACVATAVAAVKNTRFAIAVQRMVGRRGSGREGVFE